MALAHTYPSLATAMTAVREAGQAITREGLPEGVAPLVVVFTGNGNVSRGAQEVFAQMLPTFVPPSELAMLRQSHHGAAPRRSTPGLVYGCVVEAIDYCERVDGGAFDYDLYFRDPSKFVSTFERKIAPHASALVNGIYWDPSFPRLLTLDQTDDLLDGAYGQCHLTTVADITCDIEGSLQFTRRATTIGDPFFFYEGASRGEARIRVISVDNLPAQFPKDATDYFGQCLSPIIAGLAPLPDGPAAGSPIQQHLSSDAVLSRALIVQNGQLAPEFAGLAGKLASAQRYAPWVVIMHGIIASSSPLTMRHASVTSLSYELTLSPHGRFFLQEAHPHPWVRLCGRARRQALGGQGGL